MNKLFKKILSLFTVTVFMFGFATPTLADAVVNPSTTTSVYDLIAGAGNDYKHGTKVGTLTVWNDNTYLKVQYDTDTTNGWYMIENQMGIFSDRLEDRPPIGIKSLPYQRPEGDTSKLSSYQFKVKLTELPEEFYIIAHTTVLNDKIASNGETAFGGDIQGAGSSWFYYVHYSKGKITVNKTDSSTGKPQPGVTFELYDSNNKFIDSKVTDDKGEITFNNLDLGNYYLKEIVPTGYETDLPDNYLLVKLTEDEYNVTIPVVNTPKTSDILGSITVNKTDSSTGKPQSDVTFELYDSNNKFIDSKVTGTNGIITFNNLDLGNYYLKEIVPTGYETDLPDNYLLVKLTEDEYNVTIPVVNTPKTSDILGSITVNKTDSSTGKPQPGVTFELYGSNNKLYDSKVTDDKGEITFDNLALGKYYLKEIVPKGYETNLPDNYLLVQLTEDKYNVPISVVNTPIEDIPDEDIPEGPTDPGNTNPDDPAVIEDENPPYGPVLPQTGGVSADMLYMVGGLITLAGLAMFKKRS